MVEKGKDHNGDDVSSRASTGIYVCWDKKSEGEGGGLRPFYSLCMLYLSLLFDFFFLLFGILLSRYEGDVATLMKTCDSTPGCECFNSLGW